MKKEELLLFVESARAGSLSEASRRLGITPALASKRLFALEEELKVRLMHRSTRRLALTGEGELFLPHAQTLIDADETARNSIATGLSVATGILRITAPLTFGTKLLWPLMSEFMAQHPALELDLQLTDEVVDLHAQSIDVAVRIAPLADTSLIARKLCDNPLLLCAAPSYLDQFGSPTSPDMLSAHQCLVLGGAAHWSFGRGRQKKLVRVHGTIRSNCNDVIRMACISGNGIALHSLWDVEHDLDSGQLREVDIGIAPTQLAIWLIYPNRAHLPFRVRAFYDYVRRGLSKQQPKTVEKK